MFLWSANQYQEVDVIPPDGGRVHYLRTSPGTGVATAVFESTATPTRFYKSRIARNGSGWDLTLKDGTVYVFGEVAPLQAIRNRYGNTISIAHASGQNGNVIQVTAPNGRWLKFTYDASNRITQAPDHSGRTVTYTYDNANRLTQITQGTATATYTYDNANRRTQLVLPNGVTVDYSYDNASRLTRLTYKKGAVTLGDLTYTYDTAARRIVSGGSYARTGLPSGIATATYDAANQQLTLGTKSATFDANGNLATLTDPSGTTTYTWNTRNQLVSLSGPSVTASFQYDARGRRTRKIVNGVTTNFLYDGSTTVQELSGGVVQANLLLGFGIDEVLQRTETTTTWSLLADGFGSIVALTDSVGAVQTEYTYEPFGTTATSGVASANPSQYTGRENDGTGLYYYRARYYHPGLQRFISQDPIGFDGGDVNLYAYTFNNPVSSGDPLGLWTFQIGLVLNFQVGPVAANGFWGLALDGKGNVRAYYGEGLGLGDGAHVSGGLSLAGSNAQTIYDLSGPFSNGSLGGGWGPDASGDFFTGPSDHGLVIGGGVTFGLGLGTGGSSTVTNTTVVPISPYGPPFDPWIPPGGPGSPGGPGGGPGGGPSGSPGPRCNKNV